MSRPFLSLVWCLLLVLLVLCAPLARAQVAAQTDVPAAGGAPAGAVGDEDWRDTREYRLLSLGDASLRLEMVAMAMQVRDYCADRRVPDDFVRDRLARLSALSGRAESCRSLLDY